MKYNFLLLVLFLLMFSCKEPEARRPKQQSTTSFYQELIEKNKKLNEREKLFIETFITKDTLNFYHVSSTGFWYTYVKKDTSELVTPKPKDLVRISYNITDVNDNVIYETQEKQYKVDQEDFIPALQDGIKLMKSGETITFVIPSYRAFGVTGDGVKIGVNQPIKSTLTLIDIKPNKDENK